MHLQGQLFFGNATFIKMKLESMFLNALEHEDHLIKYLILDFTSVFAIDSSAAETIVNTVEICERYFFNILQSLDDICLIAVILLFF